MGVPFSEPPYPRLRRSDFGPAKAYRVEAHNGGRTVAIGEPNDLGFQQVPAYIAPGPDEVDVVIHGLPGRFIEQNDGKREIPPKLVARLLESVGIVGGTPLRLLTCHAAEPPAHGPSVAEQLAAEWGGPVTGPDGWLKVFPGAMEVDVVEWEQDPMGEMSLKVVGKGLGGWVTFTP